MPNWVTTIIEFESEEAAERVCSFMATPDCAFDFNRLLPMPKSLEIPCTSIAHEAMLWALSDEGTRMPEAEGWARAVFDWLSPEEFWKEISHCREMLARAEAEGKPFRLEGDAGEEYTLLEYGRLCLENVRLHGFPVWYGWRVFNWGTKWNARHIERSGRTVIFDTAWAFPKPVINALLKRFPDVGMTVVWAEEQFDLCTGLMIADGAGRLSSMEPDMDTFEAFILAAKVHDTGQEAYRWDPVDGRIVRAWDEEDGFDRLPVLDVDAQLGLMKRELLAAA